MFRNAIATSLLSVAVFITATPVCAQTCLDHEFSEGTEFFISSVRQDAAYRNFLFREHENTSIYWTSDVGKLIRSLQADTKEWRLTDDDWSANAVAIEFADDGFHCRAAIDSDDLYVNAASGGDNYMRPLQRSERNQIMNQLNDITRMSIQ